MTDADPVPHQPQDGPGKAERTPGGEERRSRTQELAFRQMSRPVAYYDRDKRLLGANNEWLRVMGISEGEWAGRSISDIFSAPVYQGLAPLYDEVLATGVPLHGEIFVRTPGERRAHAWMVSLSALREPSGEVVGLCSVGMDITIEHRARQRLTLVNEASARIGSTLDVARTAQELADLAAERFADSVVVELLDAVMKGEDTLPCAVPRPAALRRAAWAPTAGGTVPAHVLPGPVTGHPDGSPAARALATGTPVRYRDDDARVLAVPLRARGTTLGVALFRRESNPDDFDEDDGLLAEEITARAAVCVDNAHRYTREHRTALLLQRNLLPRHDPEEAAVEVASRYLPATSQAGVGGDWFDVIPLSGARVALVVGDVAGHGIQASATMGRLRTAVRTLADIDLPPDELLTHLDDVVVRLDQERREGSAPGSAPRDDGELLATCLYAVYDPVARRCSFVRAGHPAPALVRPDGSVDYPDIPAGPPLGLGSLPFEAQEIELDEGTLIAFFTDGLVNSRTEDIDSGIRRMGEALADPGRPLEKVCDRVVGAMLSRSPDDDAALLLARTRMLGASRVATWEVPLDPASVAGARQQATDKLAAWGLPEHAFVTELVVSELVTNAIRYAGGPIRLRLIRGNSLICEVSDSSSTAPHLRRARVFDEGGRGLLLVAQLVERWGTRQTGTGKTIWAEQPLSPAE